MSKKEETVTKKEEGSVSNRLVKQWIDEHLVNDIEDNMNIAFLAIENIGKKFSAAFKEPELVLATYGVIFQSIVEVLAEKRQDNSSYSINICDRFEIGYTDNNDNEDMEKMGSFVPYIYDLKCGKKTYDNVEKLKTIEVCTSWLSQNNIDQTGVIKQISKVALKNLAEKIDFHLADWQLIIPFFIMIHESMIGYIKMKQAESGNYEEMIDFCGCIDVFARMTEDKDVEIEFCPQVSMKLDIKSDAVTTSKHE